MSLTCTNQDKAAINMNVVIVSQTGGKPQIRWAAALSLACMLGLFTAVVAAGVYFLLSGTFSPLAAMVWFIGPFITVGSGIMRAIKNPASTAISN